MPTIQGTSMIKALCLLVFFCLPALGQDSPAKLFKELQETLPRKVSLRPGQQVTTAIDWPKVVEKLGEITARSAGTTVEPFALFSYGNALYSAGNLEESMATFQDIKTRFPKHPLGSVVIGNKGKLSPLAQALKDVGEELNFRKKHKVKTLPNPVLDDTLKVTLHLSIGDVELRFYKNVAAEHRKNFLKLASEGFYDRSCCHRIAAGLRADFGCPNTKNKPLNTWGRGSPGYSLAHEFSKLSHQRGTVSMSWTPRRTRSHGSQFQILLKDQPYLDFVQTPFAKVVKGLELIDKLSKQTKNQYEQPAKRCYINGISIEKVEPKKQ